MELPEIPQHLRKPRLRRREALEYLSLVHGLSYSLKTLETYATRGGGPLITYAGKRPLYAISDLDGWALSILSPPVQSTSERWAREIVLNRSMTRTPTATAEQTPDAATMEA